MALPDIRPVHREIRDSPSERTGLLKIPIIEALGAEVIAIQARRREDRHWIATYAHNKAEARMRSDRHSADGERLQKIELFLNRVMYAGMNGWGLTSDAYLRMIDDQDGLCAICWTEFGPELLPVVDHNHATGQIRGLLCGPCNTSLGVFKDSPDVLERALTYLEERGHYGPSEGTT